MKVVPLQTLIWRSLNGIVIAVLESYGAQTEENQIANVCPLELLRILRSVEVKLYA